VGGDSGLGKLIHFLGTDLHLDSHTMRAEKTTVQRLISIRFRYSQVIFKFAGQGFVEVVHNTEHTITIVH
jgi:hypothetical protein